MTTGLPFDDFRRLLRDLPPVDASAGAAATGPFVRAGSGDSEPAALCGWLARASGKAPAVNRPSIALFAGTHGIAARGVSALPVASTAAMVEACGAGDAAVNHLCAAHTYGLKVYDLALHLPTGDIAAGPAMDERTCAATMAFGLEAIAGGIDLMLVGSLASAGEETVVAALLAGLHGGEALDWLPADGAEITTRRAQAVEAALTAHGGHLGDPLELLRRVGGREFAAIAGAILAARLEKIPVVLEGASALAAGSILAAVNASALDHCIVAAVGGTIEARIAEKTGLRAVLSGSWRQANGTALATAAGVIRDATTIHLGLTARERAVRASVSA